MTYREWREEYAENYNNRYCSDLLDIAYEQDMYDITDKYMSYDAFNENIEEAISEFDGGWKDLRDALNELPVGTYDYYERDGYSYFSYTGWDEGREFYDRLVSEIEENMYFDEEEEDEEDEDDESESMEAELEEDSEFDVGIFTISALNSISSSDDSEDIVAKLF